MYHSISENRTDNITMTVQMFAKQMEYLKKNNYSTISFAELDNHLNKGLKLPVKPIIITFDDGYLNNYDMALPVLKKLGFKATVFLTPGYIGKINEWDAGREKLLDYPTIKIMAENNIEFGIHSYKHYNYKNLSPMEIEKDLNYCIDELNSNNCRYIKTLALPFGAAPADIAEFHQILSRLDFKFVLFIKSRINKLPIIDRFNLKRVNIKGGDSFLEFKIKLRKGRTKLF